MDKQTLSQAISKVKKYTKDLKQQVSISNPQQLSQNSISSDLSYPELSYLHTNSMAFNKTKSKIDSLPFFKQSSPPKATDKTILNTSSKLSMVKKQVQSENQGQNTFHKSQNRLQNKQLSTFLAGSLGSRQLVSKKTGHNHTYTHLKDLNTDKYSQIDSKMSTKGHKLDRFRHSKSPSKQRNSQLNYTTYGEDNYKKKQFSNSNLPQRSKSQQKQNRFQVAKLLEEINRLEEIIKKYKNAILQIKTRYKQMQAKLEQTVINDHFVDVLKCQIEELQDKNNSLNLVVAQQKQYINNFQSKFIDKINKINRYYAKYTESMISIEKQNEILKKILLISTQKPNPSTLSSLKRNQDQTQVKQNTALENISKSIQKFNQKWS